LIKIIDQKILLNSVCLESWNERPDSEDIIIMTDPILTCVNRRMKLLYWGDSDDSRAEILRITNERAIASLNEMRLSVNTTFAFDDTQKNKCIRTYIHYGYHKPVYHCGVSIFLDIVDSHIELLKVLYVHLKDGNLSQVLKTELNFASLFNTLYENEGELEQRAFDILIAQTNAARKIFLSLLDKQIHRC